MNDTANRSLAPKTSTGPWLFALWIVLPLVAAGLAITWLVAADPLKYFRNGAPPIESLTFERTILGNDGIRLQVRAGGSEPIAIAQVQVDDAFWQFTLKPPGKIARGATAWIQVATTARTAAGSRRPGHR